VFGEVCPILALSEGAQSLLSELFETFGVVIQHYLVTVAQGLGVTADGL
jgi:hypothetical protein